MKKLLLLLPFLLLGIFNATAQVDTVCAGATGVDYWVSGKAGSTFNWTVRGGTQASGSNTDSITIDFLTTTGTDTIEVVEIDSNGCIGDPVILAITRMPLPDATISNAAALCFEDSTTLSVALTGTAPWDLTFDDGSGNQTISIATSPYIISTGVLQASKTFSLIQVVDRLTCSTTLSGTGTSTVVTVYPKVITPAIQHN